MATKVNDLRAQRTVTGLVPSIYDKVLVTYPNSTTTIYQFLLDNIQLGEVTIISNASGDILSAERTA